MTKPGNIIVAGGVLILIIFAGTWFISNAMTDTSDWVDTTTLQAYNNTFNNFESYNSEMSELETKTTTTSGASSDSILGQAFDYANNLINGGWNTIKLLWSGFDFVHTSMTGLTAIFDIPDWFMTIIITLLLAVFIFGLLTVIFGKEVIGK